MALLVLSRTDVERLLPMDECIDAMAEVLAALARGEVMLPLRTHFAPEGEPTSLLLMPTYRPAPAPTYGLKAITLVPGNPSQRGLDAHQGAVLLFDGEDGRLRAAVDASSVTAIRTAAVSAVATRLLAREDARQLAILGTGVQARAHLEAMAYVRGIERARVWSPRSAGAFAAELDGRHGFPVEAAETARAAVEGADVVVTATSASTPVLDRSWLADGAHINAVGAHRPDTRELDTATVAAAAVFVDRLESALSEAGDLLIPIAEGAFAASHVRSELGELLTGAKPGRRSPDELTVFKSLGLAVEDLAAAELAVERAQAAGEGTLVEL